MPHSMWPVAPLEAHWLRRTAGTGFEVWGTGAGAGAEATKADASRVAKDVVRRMLLIGDIVRVVRSLAER